MRNFKILIVDDETITLKIVKALLEKEGAIVFTAKNGEEALEILKTSKILNELPDIILTDIFMPEMDGFQFIQEVKNQKFIIPIVALTGKGDTQTVVKLFRNGISDYVEKPFSVKDVDIIRNILKRNKEHKERLEKEKLKQQEQLSAYEYSLKEHQSIINSAIMSYKNIINVDVSKLKIPVGYIFKPISYLGGDFFAVKNTEKGISMFVADVAGHDMGASYFAVLLKMLFDEFGATLSGHKFLEKVNEKFVGSERFDRMITAQFMTYDMEKNIVEIVSSGHPAPLVINSENYSAFLSIEGGDVIGIFKKPTFVSRTISVSKGTTLIFYTDGLAETSLKKEDGSKKYLSEDELIEIFLESKTENPQLMADKAFEKIMNISNHKQQDDILISVIRF